MQRNMDYNSQPVFSVRDLVQQMLGIFLYLFHQWKRILIVGIIGSLIGFFYAFFTPVKYVSKITFVVEESKSGLGGLAGLAGQFGLDLGGSSGGSFFSGDNVILFLRSESLCRETLLTPYNLDSSVTLADRYAEVTGLKKRWLNNKGVGDISFAKFKNKSLPRLEDSLMQIIINKEILEKDLIVSKPDKKSSFLYLYSSMRDEKLSYLFSERLLDIATQKYIQSKTKYKVANLASLQRRADSLSAVLNAKTFVSASSQQSLVDVNPAFRTATISSEISTREKSMVATIFAEVVKNLEISKTILSQETPLIEIVDKSNLPLQKERKGKIVHLVLGGLLFVFIYSFFLLMKRWISNN
jgi:hypothetical protein